jgi:hypothetical protein
MCALREHSPVDEGRAGMGDSDPEDAPDATARERAVEHSERIRGGRWRRLLAGGRDDEFSENIAPLTPEQRAHLTAVTDELMKHYSLSRSIGSPESSAASARGTVSADEFEAVLETVLAEAFDFGWFDRPDLPEAPELALDAGTADRRPPSALDDEAIRRRNAVVWSEPEPEPDSQEAGDLESSRSWVTEFGVTQEVESSGGVEDEIARAETEVEELQALLGGAVAAEREAILFAAAMRERLAEAMEARNELEAIRRGPERD